MSKNDAPDNQKTVVPKPAILPTNEPTIFENAIDVLGTIAGFLQSGKLNRAGTLEIERTYEAGSSIPEVKSYITVPTQNPYDMNHADTQKALAYAEALRSADTQQANGQVPDTTSTNDTKPVQGEVIQTPQEVKQPVGTHTEKLLQETNDTKSPSQAPGL